MKISELFGVLTLCGCLHGQTTADTHATTKTEFGQHRKQEFAAYHSSYKEMKSQHYSCLECDARFVAACLEIGIPGECVENAKLWVRAARSGGDAAERNAALNGLGESLMRALTAKDQDKTAFEAEDILSQALSAEPLNTTARFEHGRALAYQRQDTAAKAEFLTFLHDAPVDDPRRRLAERFVAEPSLAAHRILPRLRIPLSTGDTLDTDAFRGQVLVVDVWASWCPACVHSIPPLKEILAPYHRRNYGIVSISIDTDREKWRKALAKRDMTWPQAIDEDMSLSRQLDTVTIPLFLLIDGSGLVLYEGSSVDALALLLPAALNAADKERAVAAASRDGN